MKAWTLHKIGDIRFGNAVPPEPARGEVLVEVAAAGVCGSDIPRIYRTGAHRHPLVPGHEFAGRVVGLGKDVDGKWLGRRVGVFPLIPCGRCAACRRGRYEMCAGYGYLGSRSDGGFAEYAAVPEWNLLELPDNVTYEQAAMLEPMAVAVHAMRNAFAHDGNKAAVAVCGFGTIGALLAMFLKQAEYSDIYVMVNKDCQKAMAASLGIDGDHVFDNRDGGAHGWLMECTDGAGVDVFFECVGKSGTVSEAVRDTAPDGTVQLVGNPASDILLDRDTYWKILRGQLTVKGSWNSSFRHDAGDDWHYALERLQNGDVHPEQCITHRLSLEELEKGLLVMRDKTEEYIKVMAVRR